MGRVGILASDKGLVVATLPCRSEEETVKQLGERVNQAVHSNDLLPGLVERLKSYFGGGKISFPDVIDLSEATPFQRKVWQAARLIPYGETRSYRWLAEKIGKPKAARAVGQALGRNPLPIIVPCHRVVASNGGLGGFTGGVEIKKRLLELEASA